MRHVLWFTHGQHILKRTEPLLNLFKCTFALNAGVSVALRIACHRKHIARFRLAL